ncbi:uncharacterized protein MONBRDRAFT_22438 [Monosiga brevicollis MX1]|uniref:Vps72/YL1 C-terminal domain-containing protein n=1 Tax=Monosiga brevicollis TaxID=81824 RepID=A9UQK7_MONBE|nr:uncharacterized protein MONBRDRAFT_22438 [Monosiga brevicollis MX1]EDQ92615.1 predicted protein [Monosiga brevicollis MX1]|eukprot:XP_001742377.1 hypothetical protein [Monosiga brevicollis MX1]
MRKTTLVLDTRLVPRHCHIRDRQSYLEEEEEGNLSDQKFPKNENLVLCFDNKHQRTAKALPFKNSAFQTLKNMQKCKQSKLSTGALKKVRTLKSVLQHDRGLNYPTGAPTYENVRVPINLKPLVKYCDLTGLLAKYTDPRTRLHFYSKEEYHIITQLSRAAVHELLELRGASTQHVQTL